MMQRLLIIFFAAAALFYAVLPVQAQSSGSGSLDEFYTYGDTYFLEVITLPGKTTAKSRVMVNFRFSYDLLTFHRTAYAYQKGNLYEAGVTMYVEAIGSDGVVGDRAMWQDTVRVQDYALTNAKRIFLPGAVELSLRPGVYTIKYIISDGTPGSGFTETMGPVRVDDFHSPSPAVGMPLFLREAVDDTLYAASIDGNALYGRPVRLYVPLASIEAPKVLRYELWSAPDQKSSATPRMFESGNGTLLKNVAPGPAVATDGNFRYVLHHTPDTGRGARSHGALVTIPTDNLTIDNYLLLLSYEAGGNSVTDSVRFSLKWEDLPLSLSNAEYAIRALYPIAGDDTIQALLSAGTNAEQLAALGKFWAAQDPTPGTHYNEAMAEYYRRVDYAFFNFKNLGQRDGVFTDRGKIYILFGPPTDVSREMLPEVSPHEIWTYSNRVGKKFVFLDDSKIGEYRLVEYYDL
jgi:GWxTD domain-containing protein